MLSQSAAFALQSEFLPKEAKMHRIVSGEPGQPSSRQCREVRQCRRPAEPSPALPIPLPSSHIPRTKSELQLAEDMHAAEWRDRCMFQRLVTGIQERQAALESQKLKMTQQQAHVPPAVPHRRRSKLRLSLAGTSSAVVAPTPQRAVQQQPQQQPKVLTVSPYQSLTSSPAQGPLALPPQQQQAPVDSRQHLQNVLYMASGLADEAIQSSATADDWSLGGYEQPQPQRQPSPMAVIVPAATQHQSYFMGPPPVADVIEDEPEEEEDDGDEIFSLDM